jgi:anaphase-promoting complex subunit 5
MPGRTVLDVFLKRMWEINSFDAFHDLFNGLGDLLSRNREEAEPETTAVVTRSFAQVFLSRTSPLGVFVRRARLEFTRLQFHDAMKLWSAFISYRAPTAKWSRRIAEIASTGIDITAADLGITPSDPLFEVAYGHTTNGMAANMISVDDFDRLLEFQMDQLQRSGCRVPDDMRRQLRNMLVSSGVMLRQSHLVKFFDAWKAGDYTSAFDNLHRYYDYAMQTHEKIHYQYALLHMAIVQADFGCFGEAIAAINETIATARENQDMTCLNFSLSWLNHMSKAYPHQLRKAGYMGLLGSERDGLLFLKSKAKETKMYPLLSSTLLNEAKHCLATGESIPRALEYMYQASHLNLRESISNFGGHILLQAALYSRLGLKHISGVHCELLLQCYKSQAPTDEYIRALCRCALTATQCGNYDGALDMLAMVDPSAHKTLKINQYIYHCAGLIKLRRATRRNDWATYAHLLLNLKPDSATDPELASLVRETHVYSLIHRGYHKEAFDAIHTLALELEEGNADILHRVSLLLVKAALFAKVGKAERCFSIALRAASIAFKARLMPLLWYSIGLLCNILNVLGEYCAASKLLDAVIPQSLEHGDFTICAMLYSFQADSFIGMAGRNGLGTSNGQRYRAVKVSRAEFYIDRACECYKRVEDISGECEQLCKKAIIAQLRGDEQLAEEWAQNYGRTYTAGMERNHTA